MSHKYVLHISWDMAYVYLFLFFLQKAVDIFVNTVDLTAQLFIPP